MTEHKVSANELRALDDDVLEVRLKEAHHGLFSTKANADMNNNPGLQQEIRGAKAKVARLRMVINERMILRTIKKFEGKKQKPYFLREKTTRAERVALTKEQKARKPRHERKNAKLYKTRRYVLLKK